ncbi:Peroxiredoxin [Austwickia chelonae]|uniref:Putative thiol-disulfide oxidoreductase n=1 Tax=Austwickia chelonae NBRC 105200 TaxID=1184607 RepID=K6VPY4_9MICO|nr:TlpA family protein disulfide reductase [Austwickia chelonae]GAB78809.1 putative thiol-disulfide oxidoreductase [Austwickia chelonae NBRC 105200]SEV84623.1 Peroxiredoxin [Austwickia chelonae]
MPERTTAAVRRPEAGPEQGDWRARLRSSRFGTIGVLLVTLVLVMGGAYLVNRPAGDTSTPTAQGTEKLSPVQLKGGASGPAPKVGEPAPEFSSATADGQEISLSQYAGRPVWLTFGASWCSACRAEFPDVQATHAAAKPDGLAVIGIYLSEEASSVKEFTQRLKLDFTHVPDPQTRIASAYRVMGVPAHVFIDKEGVVRSIDSGILSHDQIKERLAKIGA